MGGHPCTDHSCQVRKGLKKRRELKTAVEGGSRTVEPVCFAGKGKLVAKKGLGKKWEPGRFKNGPRCRRQRKKGEVKKLALSHRRLGGGQVRDPPNSQGCSEGPEEPSPVGKKPAFGGYGTSIY